MLEDAPAGIAAGKAAGMTVLAIASTHDPAELTARRQHPRRPARRRSALHDPDLGVVAHHEAVGARLAVVARDVRRCVPSSEDSIRPSSPRTEEPSSRIECSTSAFSITQPRADRACRGRRRRRAARAPAPMIAGPRTVARSSRAPASTTTRPSTWESISSPSTRRSIVSRISRLASSMSSRRPGVLPPAAHDVRLDAAARVDEPLDRVGDLELAAGGRLDRARRVVDARREHVDADAARGRSAGSVGFSTSRRTRARVVQLGDAVVLGIGHRGEQDQRLGLVRAERRHELARSRPGAGCRRGT